MIRNLTGTVQNQHDRVSQLTERVQNHQTTVEFEMEVMHERIHESIAEGDTLIQQGINRTQAITEEVLESIAEKQTTIEGRLHQLELQMEDEEENF